MSQLSIAPVLQYIEDNFNLSLRHLFSLLEIQSISTLSQNKKECRKAAQWCCDFLKNIGFNSSLKDVDWAEPGNPIVFARLENTQGHENRPCVLFYGHYDVQPVDPIELWKNPPFSPIIKEEKDGRKVIVGRGSSDDKGQLLTFLEACRAWLCVHHTLPVDVKIILEGEEETGGENLQPFIKKYQKELAADVGLICDTAMPNRTTPAITTSLRGVLAEEIVIHCANQDLHSGIYGNAARNPIHVLSNVISHLFDDDNKVTIPGFYDGVKDISDEKRQAWKDIYPDDNSFLKDVGLKYAAGEKGYSAIEQTWARPSCDVNGFKGGYIEDGFKTVIASEASAKISFRMVPGQDPQRIRKSFRDYVKSLLPKDVTVDFISHGTDSGFEISLENSKYLPLALEALTEEWGKKAICIGSGGAIPVANYMADDLKIEPLLIGFAQADDRIHSPNEQYGIENYKKGICSWVRILEKLANKS